MRAQSKQAKNTLSMDVHFFARGFLERAIDARASYASAREWWEAVSILVVPQGHPLRSGFFKSPAVSTFARDLDDLTAKKRSVDKLNELILWCT